jgi:molecular chaperone GrpE
MTFWQYSCFGNIFEEFIKNFRFMSEENTEMKDSVEQDENKASEIHENETQNEENVGSKDDSIEMKYSELNDKFLRLYSEFDNYRKRTNKEKIDLISSASSSVLKDLLPVLDDFERAILNNENVTEIEALKEGFHLIFNKFKSILETKGLKAMTTVGEVFDSELHEAIANVPASSEDMKGKVIDDVEKGYFLNEKVVRYAKVVVGQ